MKKYSDQNTPKNYSRSYDKKYSNPYNQNNYYAGTEHGHFSSQNRLGNGLKSVDWSNVTKVEGQWNYFEGKLVSRTSEEISEFMAQHSISVFGDNIAAPFLTFGELTAPQGVLSCFEQQKWEAPTPIQSMVWPMIFTGRDLVGVSRTGSGKTAGFIVPAIMHIVAQPALRVGDGPIALVLAPTRELAMQIETETQKLLQFLGTLRTAVIYGGAPKYEQSRLLRAGVHILVATPGRLIDMLEDNRTNLLRVTYLVLDEADRMLDMGFEPQVRKICSQIRTDRQTLMFSATWPKEVRNIAESFQKNFVRIHVGSLELAANKDVNQSFYVVKENEKLNKLVEMFKQMPPQRVLVFVKMKRTCDQLHRQLMHLGANAVCIHGNKEQHARDSVLAKFRRDNNCCLVATDVAARGLDIKDLDVVINFDCPMNIEDYVHRIGRTGRAGKTGDSHTFLCNENSKFIRDLINLFQKNNKPVPEEIISLGGQSHFQRNNYRKASFTKFSKHGNSHYRNGNRGGFSQPQDSRPHYSRSHN